VVVCLAAPPAFVAVGQWYEDFTPTTEAEVVRLLADPDPGTSASVVVPGAGHLFSEPGALDAVARLAPGWFVERLGGTAR